MIPSRITSLRVFTQEYFDKNKHSLQRSYPGITLNRIFSALEVYSVARHLVIDYLFDQEYSPGPLNPLTVFFSKLELGVPLEYITGYAYFYRSEFKVGPEVLIPRSETELLVEHSSYWIKERQRQDQAPLKLCDMGTGSGAILLSLLRESRAPLKAWGVDISPAALKIAKINRYLLSYTFHPQTTVELCLGDRLEGLKESFDIIVSNPPYIPRSEMQVDAHAQVVDYEPHEALFLSSDDYEHWFRVFFSQVAKHLLPSGHFMMEGYTEALPKLKELALACGLVEVKIIKDLTDRDRFLVATI